MSQNRDALAYQEHAATILAQLPSSIVPRLQATEARRVRRRPARGYAVGAQNSLVISAPCSSVIDLYKPSKLPPKGDYGAQLLELRNEGIDARAYRVSSGKPLKTCPVSPGRFCVEATK
jgi:hypothetical protein